MTYAFGIKNNEKRGKGEERKGEEERTREREREKERERERESKKKCEYFIRDNHSLGSCKYVCSKDCFTILSCLHKETILIDCDGYVVSTSEGDGGSAH